MTVPLTHSQQRPVSGRCSILFHPIIAGYVSRINTRIIRRLKSTGSDVALGEHTVAVGAVHQLPSPRGHAAVPVSEMGLATSQELVRQFEVEIVADTLLINRGIFNLSMA